MGLSGASLGVAVLMMGMPAGATTSIFPSLYGGDARLGTSCVILFCSSFHGNSSSLDLSRPFILIRQKIPFFKVGHRQMDIEKGHQILQNIRWLNQSKGELRCPLFSTLFKQTCFVKTPITLFGSLKIL